MMKSTILIGYGNPDREDDGVAWHLLQKVIADCKCTDADLFSSDVIAIRPDLDIWFNFQLLPEMAETIADYERAVFIDAHTGEIQEEISYHPIEPVFQNSPFTHHFTPASCLAVAQQLSGRYPESMMLSVRGYQFSFSQDLSEETAALVEKAFALLKKDFLE
jgi:hydrogenase maturation protease